MNRWILAASVGFAAIAAPQSRAESAPVEELFKWGEYDSLIRVLEPLVAARDTALRNRADSSALAKSHSYLGVAWYATGRMSRADEAFIRACALDSLIALDRFYVTEQIATHFQGISREARRIRQRKSALAAARSVPAPGTPAASLKGREERSWLWLGLGAAALAAAGGGAYWIANQPGPRENVTSITTDRKD